MANNYCRYCGRDDGNIQQNITLKIAGYVYPLVVWRKDEQKYRQATRELNSIITFFESNYDVELIDRLAMSAIHYCLNKTIDMPSLYLFTPQDKSVTLEVLGRIYHINTESDWSDSYKVVETKINELFVQIKSHYRKDRKSVV